MIIPSIADRIKLLREKSGITQSQLAKRLCVSRNAVNSWEMTLTTPSNICLVGLAKVFGVSTDYLLGLDDEIKIDISDLNDQEQEIVLRLVDHFKSSKE